MVQLLVKFFIQELWERKSLQILYECWQRAYHALLAQLFIFIFIINRLKDRYWYKYKTWLYNQVKRKLEVFVCLVFDSTYRYSRKFREINVYLVLVEKMREEKTDVNWFYFL